MKEEQQHVGEAVGARGVAKVGQARPLRGRPELARRVRPARGYDDTRRVVAERGREPHAVGAGHRADGAVDQARRVPVSASVLVAEEEERAGRGHERAHRVDDPAAEARARAREDGLQLGGLELVHGPCPILHAMAAFTPDGDRASRLMRTALK